MCNNNFRGEIIFNSMTDENTGNVR